MSVVPASQYMAMMASSISTEPEQGVEEELEARVDAPRPAPYADDQEHRNEAALEEQVEQDQIERREGADHQGLERQERDHVFLDAPLGSTRQLAMMQIGISPVVRTTNGSEMPSTPM